MLKITDLSLRRGSRLLLENVNLDVFPGQRMGLTGANGSGKSSLFAVIANRLEADQGNVALPRHTLITEVLQETPDSTRTAIDYVIDGDHSYVTKQFAALYWPFWRMLICCVKPVGMAGNNFNGESRGKLRP